jgi:hypothetical protein
MTIDPFYLFGVHDAVAHQMPTMQIRHPWPRPRIYEEATERKIAMEPF